MSPLQPTTILIAGGSLSSLMHALPLLTTPSPSPSSSTSPHPRRKILILERSPTKLLHNQGAGIVASPEVQQFFARYFPELNAGAVGDEDGSGSGSGSRRRRRDIVVRSKARQYLDRAGEVVRGSVEAREQRMTSWDLLMGVLRGRVVDGDEDEDEENEDDETGKKKGGDEERGNVEVEYRNGCTVTNIQPLPIGEKGVRVTWQERTTTTTTATSQEESHHTEHNSTFDLVLGADGASSTIRSLLLLHQQQQQQQPSQHEKVVTRTYAGYVAWRGTIPESHLSPTSQSTLLSTFTFFHAPGTQALGYLIPGREGTTEPGRRLFNWVWYVNYAEGSAELEDVMTDGEGRRHAVTLPVGGMRREIWDRQKGYADEILPPQFAEAVGKTERPFVQAVTDVISPTNSFLDGQVLLVGDALAGFRPHTAASTGQAAYDALRFAELLNGEIDKEKYDGLVMDFARRTQKAGIIMGERSQFGRHPFAG